MKLIFAIINNDDSHSVQSALTKSGFQATKLASSGGFLMAGNTTHKRQQFVPNASSSFSGGAYTSFPVEVTVGGATVFVTNIERFEKV